MPLMYEYTELNARDLFLNEITQLLWEMRLTSGGWFFPFW